MYIAAASAPGETFPNINVALRICVCIWLLNVKLHLKDEGRNGRTNRRVSLSVESVRGVHPQGEPTEMFHRNLTGR